MYWYFVPLSKYAVFSGRARRKEYWMFTLWTSLISISLIIIDFQFLGLEGPALSGLYVFATILPTTALAVRRLHDINMSGWWLLVWLLPVFGFILGIVIGFSGSEPGDNKYGPNPKLEVS